MIVTVAMKLKNILRDTKAPNDLLGGKAEKSNTIKPIITTKALNEIARPD